MRVAMVFTDAEPGRNGVTDYGRALGTALSAAGADVVPVAGWLWNWAEVREMRAKVRAAKADILHLQYPVYAKDGRRRMGLQLLNALQPAVVTVHDNSRWPRVSGKLSLAAFWPRARHFVFTTDFERDFALGWAPMLRGRSSVIPIGTNIPADPQADRDEANVVTFGLIRPGKGIEHVLELARLSLADGRPFDVSVIGQVAERSERYAEGLRSRSALLPVAWETGLDDAEAAQRLGRAPIAYLPFPDGASERRGSLLACLGAGCAVVTTEGDQLPAALRKAVAIADTPKAAFNVVKALLANPGERARMGVAGMAYAAQFAWPDIARRHIELYRRLAP